MKTLEFNQMENLQGGDMQGCLEAGVSGAAIVISAAEIAVAVSVASGPVGWAVLALGLSVYAFVSSVSDGDPC
jgi:hypothetical protein